MNKLFVLSGASCVGKSTILQRLVSERYCSLAPKYSTRKPRNGLYDDILYKDKLNRDCDIIYNMYNISYGIRTKDIKNKLRENSQGIIISDVKAIKKIISIFGDDMKIICVMLLKRCIEDFVNIMFLRDGIKCNNKTRGTIMTISKALTFAYDGDNKNDIERLNGKFKEFIEKCYKKDLFISFWERYNSIVNSHETFEKNRDIFKYVIYNDNADNAYHKCVEIVKGGEV